MWLPSYYYRSVFKLSFEMNSFYMKTIKFYYDSKDYFDNAVIKYEEGSADERKFMRTWRHLIDFR
jgi:hypothetical protein